MHRRSLIAGAAIATLTRGLTMSDTADAQTKTRSGEHALHGPEAGPRGDRAVSRPRAEDGRADQDAGARGLLRRHAVPSGDRGLHGAGRRPDRHRHRRFASCPTCRPSSPPSATSCAAPAAWRAPRIRTAANSQFFIMFAPAPHLDGQYTIWGQVVQGMEFVDQIKRGSGGGGTVQNPDRIVHMRVAADVKD